jgi:hypothetical protein
MEEIYKTINDFDTYSVSSFGNIKNNITGKILNGSFNKNGYKYVSLYVDKKSTQFLIHRLVATAFIENLNNKMEVDHINNNKLDNRVENLRWATRQENSRNIRIPSTNTSGVKGVFWNEQRQKYQVSIRINNKQINLGRFDTIEEATIVRQNRANEEFGLYINLCELI